MKKPLSRSLMLAATLATVLAGSQAFAGAKVGPNVVTVSVAAGNRWASGNLVDARSSSDPYQYIGCSINQTTDPRNTWAECGATNAAGQSLTCFTQSPVFLAMIQNIQPSTNMGFNVDNAGNCWSISLYNYSFYTLK